MLKNNRGLTLLEVILALTILSAFLVGFSYMIGNSALWNNKIDDRHNRLLIAHYCMELSKKNSDEEISKLKEDITDNDVNNLIDDLKDICLPVSEDGEDPNEEIVNFNSNSYTIIRNSSLINPTEDTDYKLYKISIEEPFGLDSMYLIK